VIGVGIGKTRIKKRSGKMGYSGYCEECDFEGYFKSALTCPCCGGKDVEIYEEITMEKEAAFYRDLHGRE